MADFEFTAEQLTTLRAAAKERYKLALPTILMVEDQVFFQQLLQEMLGHRFTLDIAGSIAAATEIYAEIAPCIVFLDVELPDGSGHDFARLLRRHDPDVFIVMVTGNRTKEDIEKAKQNNVQGFVVKPYNRQRILQLIEQYRLSRQPQGSTKYKLR